MIIICLIELSLFFHNVHYSAAVASRSEDIQPASEGPTGQKQPHDNIFLSFWQFCELYTLPLGG